VHRKHLRARTAYYAFLDILRDVQDSNTRKDSSWEKMMVPQLKAVCTENQLSVSGNKKDLIARLIVARVQFPSVPNAMVSGVSSDALPDRPIFVGNPRNVKVPGRPKTKRVKAAGEGQQRKKGKK